jgi:hypothetical protein
MEPALLLALLFVALIELTRALPWPASFRQAKPLSCDVCMACWSGIAASLCEFRPPLECGAAAGLALLALVVFVTPRRSPPNWD